MIRCTGQPICTVPYTPLHSLDPSAKQLNGLQSFYDEVGGGITVISATGSPDLMDMGLRVIPFGRIISLACDCAGRQVSARLLRKCVMAFFSLRQGRLLGDRAQPDFLRGAEPRNDVFLSLKGCCFPGSKKNDILTEAKRLKGAFRGCVNKFHDEVVQLNGRLREISKKMGEEGAEVVAALMADTDAQAENQQPEMTTLHPVRPEDCIGDCPEVTLARHEGERSYTAPGNSCTKIVCPAPASRHSDQARPRGAARRDSAAQRGPVHSVRGRSE